MPQLRKPLHLLAPSAFAKNFNRNAAMGRFTQADFAMPDLSEPPQALAKDPEATVYWHALAPILNHQRVITIADVTSLITYCKVLADIDRDEEIVRAEGRSSMDDKGVLRKHPLISVISENRRMSNVLAQQFGLTPASRTKAPPLPVSENKTNEFAD